MFVEKRLELPGPDIRFDMRSASISFRSKEQRHQLADFLFDLRQTSGQFVEFGLLHGRFVPPTYQDTLSIGKKSPIDILVYL